MEKTAQQAFLDRVAKAREENLARNTDVRLKSDVAINYALKKESIARMTSIILGLAEELNLDVEKLEKRIEQASRSRFGRICEMISIVSSIYAWPISESTQASEIPEIRERMLDKLREMDIEMDPDLLVELKTAKGYNSFLNEETFEAVAGVEPMYDELKFYYMTFAELAQLPIIDYAMSESVWDRMEETAIKSVKAQLESAELALAKKKEMDRELEESLKNSVGVVA